MGHIIHRITDELQFTPALYYNQSTVLKGWVHRMELKKRNEWKKKVIEEESKKFKEISSKLLGNALSNNKATVNKD